MRPTRHFRRPRPRRSGALDPAMQQCPIRQGGDCGRRAWSARVLGAWGRGGLSASRSLPQGRAPVPPRGRCRGARSLTPTGWDSGVGGERSRERGAGRREQRRRAHESQPSRPRQRVHQRWRKTPTVGRGGEKEKHTKRELKGRSGSKKVKQQRMRGGRPREPQGQLRLLQERTRLSPSGVRPQSWPERGLGARAASRVPRPNDPRRRLPRLCASWAPNRIQVAGPPVRRRARRRKPERRRQRHGILQKLPPARRGLRGVLRRPDSPSARCAPPSPSSHAPPARPVARDGVRGPQLPLSRSPPRPPAGAGRKVAPKSWYLR